MKLADRIFDFLTSRRMTIAEESMLPALRPGQVIAFSRSGPRRNGPGRGDIVLIRPPDGFGRLDVKRIVGLPGETVSIRGGSVEINQQRLDEPYLADWARTGGTSDLYVQIRLSPDEFAVLSDNRVHPGAVDSRRYGPLGRSRIVGVLSRRL